MRIVCARQGLAMAGIAWQLALSPVTGSGSDPTGSEASRIMLGLDSQEPVGLVFNPVTRRLEIRSPEGNLLEEVPAGTTGRALDLPGQELRLSFGKDEEGRPSVLVRPGPAMQKPLFLKVFERKAVISPDASLSATIGKDKLIYFEPSICGQVYYVEPDWNLGGEVSRRATAMRESAVLATPSSLVAKEPGKPDPASEYKKDLESAGSAVKSAFLTLFGLPDKQPVQKTRVYKLGSGSGAAPDPNASVPSAAAGRP